MRKDFILSLLLLFVGMTAVAQSRDKELQIAVTTATGESLEGQSVTLVQTDYQLTYSGVTLDSDGKATAKVYAGQHHISIERAGYATAETDVNVTDDVTTVSMTLTEKTRTPFALNATIEHNAYSGVNYARLQWNTEAPVFFDDFDDYDPFAIEFGQWTGIDDDGLAAAALTGDYANRGAKQYAQIINPLTVEPTWWYDYPVLRPYSGNQYVGFVRTASGQANNDWLISPAITVGTDNVLSFMAKAADVYAEKFYVYVTTVTDNPTTADFKRIDTGNYEVANDYSTWKEYTYDLSAYAGQQVKFAIRFISEYNNGGSFMLMLDDVYVGPEQDAAANKLKAKAAKMEAKAHRVARTAANPNAIALSPANPNETFDVYVDGEKVGTTDEYSYYTSVDEGTHTLGVKAKYIATESELVTTTVTVPGQSTYCHVVFNVTADSKLSADVFPINLIDKATGETYVLNVNKGKAEILSLPVGSYIVHVVEGAFEEYEQTIEVTADAEFAVTLVDRVLSPYNVTADLTAETDGTVTAVMKWNQELNFYDSFEDYDDFATGSFGDWISLDEDKNPVYPVALGSQSNIISFPGSGTGTNPTAIAPIVFNPWNTTPAMLPTDVAMQAPTGEKEIVFFSAQQATNDKWLISPEITIREAQYLSVTAKSYSSAYPETLEFCISDGSTEPSDFTVLSTAASMSAEQWTIYQTSLTDYATKKVRIGIHYTSRDMFMAQLDDFTISQENGEGEVVDFGNIDHFNIYLDGTLVGTSTTSTYTLTGLTAGDHTVGIEAVYKSSKSDMTTYALTVSGIGAVKAEAIPATAEVFNLQGQQLGSLSTLPHGIYVVKYNNKTVKIRK